MINRWEKKRLPKLLKSRQGRACAHCGAVSDTVVSAHYTGIRQHELGKGTGTKCHDLATASLCTICHVYFDQYQGEDSSEEFLIAILRTLINDIEEGVIKA